MDEFNIGDVVIIFGECDYKRIDDLPTSWRIGKVSDPGSQLNLRWSKNAKLQSRIPIMFPQANTPGWFYAHNCRHATEDERKIYFKDVLRG